MRAKTVPSKWMQREGLRLDVGPYLSGALEARVRLEELSARKDRLDAVTLGLVNAGRIKRLWVQDPNYGVPFLSSTDILKADLSQLRLIAKSAVSANPKLTIRKGWTLVTRAGSIGRMAYARPDMDGMACTEDVLRVIPNPDKIPSGYLYAYLSSKFGVPLVVSGTYGAIIQHIEPHHIADLPVPRLGEALERKVHELVEEAARARSAASALFRRSDESLHRHLGIHVPKKASQNRCPPIAIIASSCLQSRADAYYYSPWNRAARAAWDGPAVGKKALKEVASVFIPGIFKRRYADDAAHGFPYITGGDVFQLAPTSDRFLMKAVADRYQLVIREGTILVQEAGQLGGLIGRSVLAGRYLDGFACTNNMVRVTPNCVSDAGYLYALLASEFGVSLISREAAGSSIPHIEVGRVRRMQVPWPDRELRLEIGAPAKRATELRDQACELDIRARTLLENAIEEAT